MRIFVIGGSPEARPPAGLAPAPGDRVIAADRGAVHARAWGWPVHLLVGDLDSLGPRKLRRWPPAARRSSPRRQPRTRLILELALAQALIREAREIVICAALGGRADHMLANVLLLARPELAGLCVTLVDGRSRSGCCAAIIRQRR